LRRLLIAALSLSMLWLAMPATPALAASDAKVVVVVGPVGSHTAHYKDDANQIVTEARRWTTNVVKVYTPNATWAKVKAAAQGASVLVYLGHGNGWPSIYAPFQTLTKNGLGLDPSTGADSTKTVYYGEQYIARDIRLAPNAVVLLYHLCYASGNTEPGLAVGSFADSRERVDNYGAGFIGAGARAVIAEGHPAHPVVDAVRQLFTTKRTLETVFRSAPTAHGNVLGPYPSERTPGLSFLMDPDSSAPSGFYRSIIGDLALTTNRVVSSGLVPTDIAPADFVLPGSAEVVAPDGAGLWGKAGNAADPESIAPSTLSAGTKLRLTSEEAPAADGTRIFGVRLLAGTGTGFVRSTSLAPRDSSGPDAWSLDQSAPWLSPNGDGTRDAFVVAARFSEAASAVLRIKNAAATTVKTLSATGDIARLTWDLRTSSGANIPDGAYTWKLSAADPWGNAAFTATGGFTVDSTAPVTTATADATAGSSGWLVTPPTVTLSARDGLSGVRTISWRVNGSKAKTYGAPVVVDASGAVTFEYRAVDNAGIREPWRKLALKVDTSAPSVVLAKAGKAGDVPDTWRGKVTITPQIRDAASGVASARYRVDEGETTPVGSDAIVVSGNGAHTVVVTVTDVAGNRTRVVEAFVIDSIAPTVDLLVTEAAIPTVSPNGDGRGDRVSIPFSVSEQGAAIATITGSGGSVVRTITLAANAGPNSLAWDGTNDAGKPVADGRYTVAIAARDAAGNTGPATATVVDVFAALASLVRSSSLFYPQDGDALASKVSASWTLLSPTVISVRVLDGDGRVVRTGPTDRSYPAGAWNGRTDAGAFAARGVYRVVVTAGNGAQSATQQVSVRADAFRLGSSRVTAVRGTSLVLTAVTAEPLATAPRVVVRQPGLDPRSVTMIRQSATRWTAEVRPRKGGTPGTLRLVVKATDTAGGANRSTLRLVLE
jgi:flagellar hook assembly protein FlgD